MSIDLSRVTGISDSRGVITEIKDSLGRVIWSAIKEVGTLIFRPSADISFTGDKYPTDLAYGYLAISEVEADGFATYIGTTKQVTNGNISVEGTFSLSADTPVTIKKVLGGELGVACKLQGHNNTGLDGIQYMTGLIAKVAVLGAEYTLIDRGTVSTSINFDGLKTATLPIEMVNRLNTYISTNGVLPEITLYLLARAYYGTDTSDKKTITAQIDQAYLSLECE